MEKSKKSLVLSIIIFTLVTLSMIGILVFVFFPRGDGEIPCETEEDSLLKIDVDKSTSDEGNIDFELTFNDIEGEFTIYFADSEKKALASYTPLDVVTITKEQNTVQYTDVVLPRDCAYIMTICLEGNEFFAKIPEEYLISEELKYKYGALSDVHLNYGNYLDGALDFLDTQDVEFVGISGDLTYAGEKEYLELFNETIKDRDYKVYTTSGNHDQNAITSGEWLATINTTIKTDNEVVEIAENGLDFVFKPNKAEDSVFVFLCQTRWYYPSEPQSTEYTILQKEQLEWLRGVLEANKENNVFLFFHTFLSAPDGTQESAVGNLRNPGGYAYNLPFSYGSADETELRNLLKQYKNVVFFSGHSHWMFEMEIYNEMLNVSSYGGEYGYMVHIPSISAPRWIGELDTYRTEKTGDASEGWIVEVYDDYILLIPVDFISQAFYTEYIKMIPLS